MKVERKEVEPKFEPITITLETKEEANLMYHMLNCGEGTSLKEYYKDINASFPIYVSHRMYDLFSNIWSAR